jgi:hypothetical protein
MAQAEVRGWCQQGEGCALLLVGFTPRSLWHAYDTVQCREQLEEKSHDEQGEPIYGRRKGSIRRRLTLRLNRRSAECGTQPEEGSDIPEALLDIIFKRIFVALLERPQSGGALSYFPNTEDDYPDEVEEQSNHGEELHTPPVYKCVWFNAGFPYRVDDQRR